jgi:hypothetical protein
VVKKALVDALNSNEPVSLNKIAIAYGYTGSGTIRSQFPKLYAAVALKVRTDKARRLKQMRQGLEEALREDPPPSLLTVVLRLGFSTSTVLRENEPELTSQIAARYRRSFKERGADLAKKAELIITENPPPSVKELCGRLRISKAMMDKYAPELRSGVALRFREWKSEEKKRRHKELFREIHEIAAKLDRQGFCPTPKRILKLLSPGRKAGWRVINNAICEARDALTI